MSETALVTATAAVFLCAGGAFGCAACMVTGRLLRRTYLASRFMLFCVLLSAAVAGCSALIVFAWRPVSALFLCRAYLVCFAAAYVLGFLCAVFWKVVLPLAVLLYIAGSALTGMCLYIAFGSQSDRFEIAVQGGTVLVDGVMCESGGGKSASFVLYTLPPALLFPLPRVWYHPAGAGADPEKTLEAVVGRLPLSPFVQRYAAWCLKSRAAADVPLGGDWSDPALFTCTVSRSWERISFDVHRDL